MRFPPICAAALLALAAPAMAMANDCGWFTSQLTDTVGSTPHSFAAADFNEDGITDLAVANQASHTLSVLIGHGTDGVGDGTFATAVTYPAQLYPLDVVAADFNGDGRLDLAVSVQSNIAFYFGRGSGTIGDGTFDPPIYRASSGFRPRGMTLGDFNEDGIVDLAITNGASTTIGIWLGNGFDGVGDGTFAPEVIYFTGLGPVRVATGDFNEDGITDLIATDNHPVSNNIGVLIGNGSGGKGDGTFKPVVNYHAGTAPLGIALGDFNSDTIMDLAITNSTSNDVSFLFGQGVAGVGDGTFSTAVTMPLYSGPREIVAGDFNWDGATDLVIAQSAGFVKVLKGGMSGGIPNGTFTAVDSIATGINPIAVKAGSFVEDLVADLAVTNAGSASVSILPGACPPTEQPTILVLAPITGGMLLVGSEQYIRWSKSASIAAVDIEVSRDNGSNWQTIATNRIETRFKWSVTPPITTAARVRVHSSINPTIASTTGTFSITAASGVPDDVAGRIPTLAWPNPFHDRVRFQFTVPAANPGVDVAVFDVSGRLIKRIHSGPLDAGPHDFLWDGTGLDGRGQPAGIYFMRAAGPGFNTGLKFIRIR